MLDHFGLVVKDLEKSSAFYENCLLPLGLKIVERHSYGAIIIAKSEEEKIPFIWIGTGRPSFWSEEHQAGKAPMHLCFKANSPSVVDTFYKAALANGGKDNGAPGFRKSKSSYYAAFVIDPDGHNIEASYRE